MLEHSDTLQFVQEIQQEKLIVRQMKTKKGKENVAIAFPVYVPTDAARVRHEVQVSCMNYFQTISCQAQLDVRGNSPEYAYRHEIRIQVEGIRWEGIETMVL